MEKPKKIRIAIRETATELTRMQMELVAGGGPNDDNKGPVCDLPTDCWVTGGDFVFNDD
jgi:hypothetical protein